MVDSCVNALIELLNNNPKVVLLGADFMNVAREIPESCRDRYIDVGIAECSLVGAAAGMTDAGYTAFVYGVAPFLAYRANEFIRDDVCMQKRNVKMIGFSSGVDYSMFGATHHATEEVAVLRSYPNLTILSPGSPLEVKECIEYATKVEGPVYIRLSRVSEKEFLNDGSSNSNISPVVVREGKDIVLFTTGTMVYECLEFAETNKDLSVKIIHVPKLKPVDDEIIKAECNRFSVIMTVEEHSIVGGLGSIVAEIVADNALNAKLIRVGLNDSFAVGYGMHKDIKEKNGLSVAGIRTALANNGIVQ